MVQIFVCLEAFALVVRQNTLELFLVDIVPKRESNDLWDVVLVYVLLQPWKVVKTLNEL